MSDYKPEMEQLEDDHLDAMLRLAFDYKEDIELQELIEKSKRELTPEEEAQAGAAYQLFEQKYEQEIAKGKAAKRYLRIRHVLGGVARIAACILLILVIATPFAVANIGLIRERVLRILLSFDEGNVDVTLVDDSMLIETVPTGWKGAYYPSYIPEGFVLASIATTGKTVCYTNAEGLLITYGEFTKGAIVSLDDMDATRLPITINDFEGYAIVSGERVEITWSDGDYLFVLTADLSLERTVELAKSVVKVRG